MASDLKEAIENFKSAARPFQAIVELVEQLESPANDLRVIKDVETRKQALAKEEEAFKELLTTQTEKLKVDTNQKIEEATKQAELIVVEARRNAENVLNSAQVKASAITNDTLSKEDKAKESLKALEADLEFAKQELAKTDQLALVAEERLVKAHKAITKLLNGE